MTEFRRRACLTEAAVCAVMVLGYIQVRDVDRAAHFATRSAHYARLAAPELREA